MGITETWLSVSIYNLEILPSSFTMYRRDRHSTGGGVLLAISSTIPSTLVLSATDMEQIIVKLLLPKPILLCCVYLPPSSPPILISKL